MAGGRSLLGFENECGVFFTEQESRPNGTVNALHTVLCSLAEEHENIMNDFRCHRFRIEHYHRCFRGNVIIRELLAAEYEAKLPVNVLSIFHFTSN